MGWIPPRGEGSPRETALTKFKPNEPPAESGSRESLGAGALF